MATVQPTAFGLDFPMATHIALPDTVNLSVKPDSVVALYGQFHTTANISSNVLAMVSLASQEIEAARTITGAQQVARSIMTAQYHWGVTQFGCLKALWNHESHWNYKAHNYSSGAHGIAQALPADKMDVTGTDWRTNPVTQIRWGLRYIETRYSTPCKALGTFNWIGSY
jgi:pyruvate dehydrogenase complex dehydrogenase (E1) component